MYVLRIGALPIFFLCFYSFVSDHYFKLKYIKIHHKLQAFRFYYVLFSLQGVHKVKINPGNPILHTWIRDSCFIVMVLQPYGFSLGFFK